MLRITIHEQDGCWRLQLEGKLAGVLVAEVERVWDYVPAVRDRIEIDLRGVTAIDAAGERLLGEMHESGANFLTKGVAVKALVDKLAMAVK